MKHTNKQGIRHFALMAIVMMEALFSACSKNGNNFNFKTSTEALNACHSELSKIKTLKEIQTDKLVQITCRWLELQDSTIACLMRDSTVKADTEIAADFFAVSDTFRTEITRLALEVKRPMKDIVKLKVETAKDRSHVQESEDYKKACDFYDKINATPLYDNIDKTLSEYEKLLTNADPFKKEGQLYDFIQKEDRCFRSLLMFLKDTPQDRLKNITDKTSKLFDVLYRNANADMDNKNNERILMYLNMRFNRRILQNADVCRQDIKKKVKLDEVQLANYRWMIIQPFMTIDDKAMATLTEQQVKTLTDMATELPQLLAYLDGKDYEKSSKEVTDKLENVLCEYFLKSYLSSIL